MSKFLIEDIEVLEAPEAVLSTMTKEGKRRWMYPVPSKGRLYKQRLVVAWALIAFFVALPLIKINGYPALLFDIMNREFAIFGLVLYPTDTILLLMFMVGTIMTVVLGTALWGRVWCGWACPQTVYLEFVFRPIERLIEGPPHRQARRDAGDRSFDRTWRKAVKFVVFLGISFLLANIFVSYFVGWDQLATWMTGSPLDHWGFFVLMAGVTGLMLFDFGYFREQMCTITCPYARMQSVLLDKDSTIVSYDPTRGEPRTKRSRKILQQEADGAQTGNGDCIDCKACVRTCPTGIDIRDGLQMECVSCTQCIDACDHIMDNIGKPRGLIRYTSENALEGKSQHTIRPRTAIYVTLIVAIFAALGFSIATRSSFDVNIGRITGAPYIEVGDGTIANRIRFRVRNQTPETVEFSIVAIQPENAEVRVSGVQTIELAPAEMKRVETFVVVPQESFSSPNLEAVFRLTFSDGSEVEKPFILLGPES